MTRQLIIGVDLDNTVVAWESAYARDAVLIDPAFPVDEFMQRGTYDLDTATSSKETRYKVMQRRGFYREMDILPGAKEALEAMVSMGHQVFLISQPDVDNPTGHSDKLWWVRKHLGAQWATRLVLTHDKTLWRGDILIDDKPVVSGLLKPSWQHIYFTQRYNADLSGPRIDSWSEWNQRFTNMVTDELTSSKEWAVAA